MPFRSKPSQLVFCKSPGTMPLRSEPSHFFMQITWQMAFNSETSEFLFQISCPKPLRSEPLQNQYEVYISILFNNHVIPRVVLFTWHSAKYLCWWPGILKQVMCCIQTIVYLLGSTLLIRLLQIGLDERYLLCGIFLLYPFWVCQLNFVLHYHDSSFAY